MEGPFLALQTALVSVAANQTSVVLPVELSGPSMLPVSVSVTVPQQLHSGPGELAIGYTLQTPSLTWPAGQDGTRNMTLSLGSGMELQEAALAVQLSGAVNADLDPVKHTALVTGLPAEELVSTFAFTPNQVQPH